MLKASDADHEIRLAKLEESARNGWLASGLEWIDAFCKTHSKKLIVIALALAPTVNAIWTKCFPTIPAPNVVQPGIVGPVEPGRAKTNLPDEPKPKDQLK